MPKPTITVIIPVYRVEDYLEKCVKSVLAQTYTELEVILVDDGSPDACPALCDELARQDPRIRVIHKANGGLSSARNTGLDAAAGDYVAFIDSDDYIAPDMFERLYTALTDAGAQIALCDVALVDETGTETRECAPLARAVYTPREACEAMAAEYDYWRFVTAWNRLCARSIFETLRFPEGKLHEDEFTVLPVFGRCSAIAVIPDKLYFYLQRGSSIMGRTANARSFDAIEAQLGQYRFYREQGWRDLRHAILMRSYDRCKELLRDADVYACRKAARPRVLALARALILNGHVRGVMLWRYYRERISQCRRQDSAASGEAG